MEIWRPIEGTDGRYEVSNTGKVRSLNYGRHGGTREMSPVKDKKGYLRVRITRNGKNSTVKVHRIVAETFIPNVDNKPQVNHINGVKDDNRAENLEWVNNSENQKHAFDNGYKEKTREWCRQMGNTIGKEALSRERELRKTPVVAIKEDGTEILFGSQQEASKATSVPQANINKVLKGQRRSAGGYRWRYAQRG